MTEMTRYEAPLPTAVVSMQDHQSAAVASLGQWAQSADAAYTVAERLVQTAFVPAAFKGKPIEATAAILAGLEVGLSPMASLRSFDIIQGQAAPRAITLRAIVQSHGHEIVLVETTATRCTMRGKRRGTDEWQTATWTMDRARDLQLTGKDNWKKQPAAMLMARATGEIARLVAADAILGIAYTAEEIADGGAAEATYESTTNATPTPRRTLSRKKANPVDQEADLEPLEDEPQADPEPEPITKRTRGQLFALFGQKGIAEDEQLPGVCHIVGRQMESRSEITEAEALQVIEVLKAKPDAQGGDAA